MSRPVYFVGIDASRAADARPTGVERYSLEVIERLKGIIPPSVQVLLYLEKTPTGALAALPPNWTARVLRWPCRYFWAELRLGWEMLVHPPDLLWVPARALPLILPRRALATVHDLGFIEYPAAYGFLNRVYQVVSLWLAARRAAVITISEYTAAKLRERFGELRRGLSVVPLAADTEAFARAAADAPGQAERRARLGLAKPYLLFVGRLETKKNIDGLLTAFAQFAATTPDVELALVGKRGLGAAEALAALPPEATARVRELGYVGAADLPYVYAAAHAFVFPSRYEGFGIPVLEAFAACVPVLCSDAASLPEVAGDAALLVSPSDTAALAEGMRRLTTDAALRERLVERGLARLPLYDWTRTAARTWQAMEGLLEGERK
jgi:glycosyltransferase involved in cell wall biosynthesis